MREALLLKWGTVKGWDNLSDKSQKILERYFADGIPCSAMTDNPDSERKELLCELIEQLEGDIQNDWTGEMMSKDEAKEYVRQYGSSK